MPNDSKNKPVYLNTFPDKTEHSLLNCLIKTSNCELATNCYKSKLRKKLADKNETGPWSSFCELLKCTFALLFAFVFVYDPAIIYCLYCYFWLLARKAQPDTTRVLFIGNSFTYTYDVPTLVQGLSTAAGYPLKFVMHAPGGISVGDTAQGTSAHMNNPIVFDLIRSDNWDFVSLQDNQGRFIYGNGNFPDTNVSKVIKGHLKIGDSVHLYHPCARMLWFAGWGPENGYLPYAATGKGLIDNIYVDYLALKNIAGEMIAPIGKAWERELDTLPSTDLWGPDQTHESLAGAYLTASVIFTSIYRMNTELVSFDGGLDSATARALRRIAYHTVIDSITPANLSHYIPDINFGSGTITATSGYAQYNWFRDDTLLTTTATNSIPLAGNGCYYVIASSADTCTARSVEKCIATTGLDNALLPMPVVGIPCTNT
jgi:hypothetical protein